MADEDFQWPAANVPRGSAAWVRSVQARTDDLAKRHGALQSKHESTHKTVLALMKKVRGDALNFKGEWTEGDTQTVIGMVPATYSVASAPAHFGSGASLFTLTEGTGNLVALADYGMTGVDGDHISGGGVTFAGSDLVAGDSDDVNSVFASLPDGNTGYGLALTGSWAGHWSFPAPPQYSGGSFAQYGWEVLGFGFGAVGHWTVEWSANLNTESLPPDQNYGSSEATDAWHYEDFGNYLYGQQLDQFYWHVRGTQEAGAGPCILVGARAATTYKGHQKGVDITTHTPSERYLGGDVVSFQGSLYVAVTDTGFDGGPPSTNPAWMLFNGATNPADNFAGEYTS